MTGKKLSTPVTAQRKERNLNLDLIRCLAVFSVLSIHFFYNNGFYGEPQLGGRMYLMTVIRTFFCICVPLFMILSGYLMNQKELSRKYYKGIWKIIIIYLLASIACAIHDKFFLHKDITLLSAINGLFTFETAQYSWYINMYIGLFLLIPFLNLAWNQIPTKKGHQALVGSLLFCTSLPTLLPFLPNFWSGLYPLTYYFIGAYLKKYKPERPARFYGLLLLLAVFSFGTFNFWYFHGTDFSINNMVSWRSYQNVIDSVLIFCLILKLNLKKLPGVIKWVILKISEISLGIYLVSSIFDHIAYPVLNAKVPEVPNRLEYYLMVVPFVFLCSALLSQVLVWIQKGIAKIFKM